MLEATKGRAPRKSIIPVEAVTAAPKAPVVPEEPPEVMLGLEDKSPLNETDRIQVIVNLLRCLPPQYQATEEMTKQNVWNIGRFEPTRAMITKAREIIAASEAGKK